MKKIGFLVLIAMFINFNFTLAWADTKKSVPTKVSKRIETKAPPGAMIVDKNGKARPSTPKIIKPLNKTATADNKSKNAAKTVTSNKVSNNTTVASNKVSNNTKAASNTKATNTKNSKTTAKNKTDTTSKSNQKTNSIATNKKNNNKELVAKTSKTTKEKNTAKTTDKASSKNNKTIATNKNTETQKNQSKKQLAKEQKNNKTKQTAKESTNKNKVTKTTAKSERYSREANLKQAAGKTSLKNLAKKTDSSSKTKLTKKQTSDKSKKLIADNENRVKNPPRASVKEARYGKKTIANNSSRRGQTQTPQLYQKQKVNNNYMKSNQRQMVISTAKQFIGVPYRYGGVSPRTGFDCSGFVSYVYKLRGFSLPRTSAAQFTYLPAVKNPLPGDLVFFSRRGRINHVGIYLGNGQMLHSPQTGSRVRVESLNRANWKRRYAGARSVIPHTNSKKLIAWNRKADK